MYGGAVRFMNGSGLARRGKNKKARCAGIVLMRHGLEESRLPVVPVGASGTVPGVMEQIPLTQRPEKAKRNDTALRMEKVCLEESKTLMDRFGDYCGQRDSKWPFYMAFSVTQRNKEELDMCTQKTKEALKGAGILFWRVGCVSKIAKLLQYHDSSRYNRKENGKKNQERIQTNF